MGYTRSRCHRYPPGHRAVPTGRRQTWTSSCIGTLRWCHGTRLCYQSAKYQEYDHQLGGMVNICLLSHGICRSDKRGGLSLFRQVRQTYHVAGNAAIRFGSASALQKSDYKDSSNLRIIDTAPSNKTHPPFKEHNGYVPTAHKPGITPTACPTTHSISGSWYAGIFHYRLWS